MKGMFKQISFVLSLLALFVGLSPAAFSGMKTAAPVCLTDCAQIPSVLEKYTQAHPIKTEQDEINYLLYRIRSSHSKFIRNGSEYNPAAAATFLRWKIGWYQLHYHEKIDNDEKFVAKIMKGSEKTGEPYRIILEDGKRLNAQLVLLNEYHCLEAYQGETPEIFASDLHLR